MALTERLSLKHRVSFGLLFFYAGVAQLVEHHLAKVDVEGSNPFARSIILVVRKHLIYMQEYSQSWNILHCVPLIPPLAK